MALLSMSGISKRFGAVDALSDVNFDAEAGQVTALVGDNGAGKSTLIKTIAGTVVPDRGAVVFDGQPVAIRDPRTASELGIRTIYQDLALSNNLDVAANLYLGREQRRHGLLDETGMERETRRVLVDLSVRIPDVAVKVGTLSGGQRQSIAIARAVLGRPRVVLLDEPTAALGVAQTREVLELVRRLADGGLVVVLISHNLADVFAVADVIHVLRLGRNAGCFAAREANEQLVVGAITGASGAPVPQRA